MADDLSTWTPEDMAMVNDVVARELLRQAQGLRDLAAEARRQRDRDVSRNGGGHPRSRWQGRALGYDQAARVLEHRAMELEHPEADT